MPVGEVTVGSEDLLITVHERDQPLGPLDEATCHRGEGVLHRALSVYLFDHRGCPLLQKRSNRKPLWPRYWSNSCCSHPRWGEDTAEAAHRRVGEELGISVPLQYFFAFQYQAQFSKQGAEHEFCHVFAGVAESIPEPDPLEVEDWAFVDPVRLDDELERRPDTYTPWLHLAWRVLRRDHWRRIAGLPLSLE